MAAGDVPAGHIVLDAELWRERPSVPAAMGAAVGMIVAVGGSVTLGDGVDDPLRAACPQAHSSNVAAARHAGPMRGHEALLRFAGWRLATVTPRKQEPPA